VDRLNTDPGISYMQHRIRVYRLFKVVSHAPLIAKPRNNEGCYMVEELEQGPRADMITIEVPDYFKRPSQVEDTGSSCVPTCVLEVFKTREG